MPFQILSLSGGGYLGYYTASVIAGLEKQAGRPLAQCFDLMGGTSVGGIIALCLAQEVPAEQIREAFEKHGTRIFSGRPKSHGIVDTLGEIARSAFAPSHNARALRSTIGDLLGPSLRLGDLKHSVLISSVDLTSGEARLFESYNDEDKALNAVDVAMATSAVPTFFPMVRIGKGLYADGGLFANAPDLQAVHAAQYRRTVPARQLRVLSVGTASSHFPLSKSREKLGAIDWMTDEHLMRIAMSAQQSSVETMLREQFGDHYLRIDARQSPAQRKVLGLTVATKEATRMLGDLARQSVKEVGDDARLIRMLRHKAGGRLSRK